MIKWIAIPILTDADEVNDDELRQEWINLYRNAVDPDQPDSYFDGDNDTNFWDWIYAEITASISVARRDGFDRIDFYSIISYEAVAWAWERLMDNKSLY